MEIERDLDGEFVKENSITKLLILQEPKIPENGFSRNVLTKVQCNDKQKTIALWTLNKQCKNTLIDKFGTNTIKMTGKEIPVIASPYGRDKFTINVDRIELLKRQTVIAK